MKVILQLWHAELNKLCGCLAGFEERVVVGFEEAEDVKMWGCLAGILILYHAKFEQIQSSGKKTYRHSALSQDLAVHSHIAFSANTFILLTSIINATLASTW